MPGKYLKYLFNIYRGKLPAVIQVPTLNQPYRYHANLQSRQLRSSLLPSLFVDDRVHLNCLGAEKLNKICKKCSQLGMLTIFDSLSKNRKKYRNFLIFFDGSTTRSPCPTCSGTSLPRTWCRSIVIRCVMPALVSICAISFDTMQPRFFILDCLEYGRYGMTPIIFRAQEVLHA